MRSDEILERLIARARMESPPRVEVADRVMARIRGRASSPTRRWEPLAWVAAVSCVVASCVLLAVMRTGESWTDALASTLIDVPWVVL